MSNPFSSWSRERVEEHNRRTVSKRKLSKVLPNTDADSTQVIKPFEIPDSWISPVAKRCNGESWSRTLKFSVKIDPMGAPRQTRADAWKKRPVVLRYRAYATALQMAFSEACGGDLPTCPDRLDFVAHIAMPDSWSDKKLAAMDGQGHRSKPDADNILKGCDTLFDQDAGIWQMSCKKLWCREGGQRLEITMYWQ